MYSMVIILVSAMAGLMIMTIASLYKWALKYWNEDY